MYYIVVKWWWQTGCYWIQTRQMWLYFVDLYSVYEFKRVVHCWYSPQLLMEQIHSLAVLLESGFSAALGPDFSVHSHRCPLKITIPRRICPCRGKGSLAFESMTNGENDGNWLLSTTSTALTTAALPKGVHVCHQNTWTELNHVHLWVAQADFAVSIFRGLRTLQQIGDISQEQRRPTSNILLPLKINCEKIGLLISCRFVSV